MNGGLDHDRRGISPVFGVVLLVVIVGLLATVTATMALSMADDLPEPAPMVATSAGANLTVTDGAVSDQELVFVHESGQSIAVDRLTVVVDTPSGPESIAPVRAGDVTDGTWSAGERLRVPLETDLACGESATVTARIRYSANEQSYIISRKEVPVSPNGFTITGGTVVPASSYTAEVSLLGIGFTNGEAGPPIDAELAVHIANETHRPWTGNLNDGANPRSHTFTDQQAGAPIAVSVTADPEGEYISPRTRHSSDTDGFVYVLRDGDTPPDIDGFGNQDSVEEYVSAHVDGDGTISLADNQAVYLFELSDSTTGPAADFQDAVVLVDLTTAETDAGDTVTAGSKSHLVCQA
jgi:flagellin-like protein